MLTQVHVFVVDVPGAREVRRCVTLLPTEIVFRQGVSPEAIVGVIQRRLGPEERITPDVFAPSRDFPAFLHSFIARRAPEQPEFQAAARRQGNGWLYVVDQRTPTPDGQVPTEDIVGAFELHDGTVEPGSYQPNLNHTLLSWHGWFQLGPTLNQLLLQDLIERNAQWNGQVDDGHKGRGDGLVELSLELAEQRHNGTRIYPVQPVAADGNVAGEPVALSIDRSGLMRVTGAAAAQIATAVRTSPFVANPFDAVAWLPATVPGLRWSHVTEGPILVRRSFSYTPDGPVEHPVGLPQLPSGAPGQPAAVAAPGHEVVLEFFERNSPVWEVHVAADGRVLATAGSPIPAVDDTLDIDGRPVRLSTDPISWTRRLHRHDSEFSGQARSVVRMRIRPPRFEIASTVPAELGITADGLVTILSHDPDATAVLLSQPVAVPGRPPAWFTDDPLTWLRHQGAECVVTARWAATPR